MIKTLTIGDLHGRDIWEQFADLSLLIDTPNLKTEYDKYIFLGDYTDSFVETNVKILHNLKRLIKLKNNYPDEVILLLGNHDLQYLLGYELHGCSGYRPEAYFDLHELFRENRNKFQAAFQIDSIIWSHAGIHHGWYEYEFPYESPNVADDINTAFLQGVDCLFDVGHSRGGWKHQGGPFWADRNETSKKPLKGFSQVMGHTPVDSIQEMECPKRFKNKNKDNFLLYCDCTDHGIVLDMEIDKQSITRTFVKVDMRDNLIDFDHDKI